MSKFPITIDDVHAAIRQKGHGWHPAQTSMSVLEHEEALKYLGYTPSPDEPTLTEREQRAAAAAAAAGSGPASGTAAPSSTVPGTTAPGTAVPAAPTTAGAAAPGTSGTAAGAPPAGSSAAVTDWRNYHGYNWVTPIQNQGACGSCVSFATSAATESAMLIGTNNPNLAIQLSEAQLFYCVARSQGRALRGADRRLDRPARAERHSVPWYRRRGVLPLHGRRPELHRAVRELAAARHQHHRLALAHVGERHEGVARHPRPARHLHDGL